MGLLARLLRRGPAPIVALDPRDDSLVVLVTACEAWRADSEVLSAAEATGVDLSRPLLLRHHLIGLPDEAAVARAAELLGQDGYTVLVAEGDPRPIAVHASRTQLLTALSASQERSRMAGLAQRLGGDVAGWHALGRACAP